MSQAREIRSKIGSIKNTQKITSAMQLVAASKMRRAQNRMAASRPYAQKIRTVISHVAASHSEYHHPYLEVREKIQRVGFIVISTDRGLCGGLNVNLFRHVILELKQWESQNVEVDLCLIGSKAEAFFGRIGAHVLAATDHLGDTPEVEHLIGLVKTLLDRYDEGKLDAIYIASNDFVTTMKQKAEIRPLLPLQQEENTVRGHWDYIYEPDSSCDLLSRLLVRYIESQVYQAVIENIACEQAARMVAMKNATENASDLIKDLQLIYNKARQASITQEIVEIVSGTVAIE